MGLLKKMKKNKTIEENETKTKAIEKKMKNNNKGAQKMKKTMAMWIKK